MNWGSVPVLIVADTWSIRSQPICFHPSIASSSSGFSVAPGYFTKRDAILRTASHLQWSDRKIQGQLQEVDFKVISSCSWFSPVRVLKRVLNASENNGWPAGGLLSAGRKDGRPGASLSSCCKTPPRRPTRQPRPPTRPAPPRIYIRTLPTSFQICNTSSRISRIWHISQILSCVFLCN